MTKLMDFWASWCGPCKIMNPIIDEIEKELAGKIEVERINVDEQGAVAEKFRVMSIPTYIIVRDDKEVSRKVGVTPKTELLKLLQ